ncbi:phosphoenolpyruvate--protein phosphotransferase [Acidithiobacillus albertensis]|uniref:phosphoenolpyruvate--protein phosphotransferase n=1 Tax=Acidithiobacillus albertensis TaxID=119978 RepID=UPI00098238E3|nr:putative PEP-binding protein [Acidithiobacillus albertensis]
MSTAESRMNTVGLVLVSHSRALAMATETLIRQVTGSNVRMAIAAGAGDEGADLGTDALQILAAIESLDDPMGTLVLMDMGSALLSTETALGLLSEPVRARVLMSSGPFVEGAMAAAMAASGGAALSEVRQEAENGLRMKQQQLAPDNATAKENPQIPADSPEHQLSLYLADPAGLHLRPAAALAKLALARSTPSFIAAAKHPDNRVSASSLTAILGLDLRQGDEIYLQTSGPDADAFLDRAAACLQEDLHPPAKMPVPVENEATKHSQGAAPGFAQGPLIIHDELLTTVPRSYCDDCAEALHTFLEAVAKVRRQLSDHPILEAQNVLLSDPALLKKTTSLIQNEHLDAASAWAQSISQAASQIDALSDPILRARSADLRDLGNRVLQALGVTADLQPWQGPPAILLVNELLPSVALRFDPEQVLGVIDRHGSANSHAAILLRGSGIPYVINADPVIFANTQYVAMDGKTGELWPDPDARILETLHDREQMHQDQNSAGSYGQITLSDGSTLELWANVASTAEAAAARRLGATGIGLLRTEFFFLDQQTLPDEESQCQFLRQVMAPMQGLPIVVRALDAGADKPLTFMALGAEANPALGRRGLRALLAYPDIFALQLRAMLRAGRDHNLRIMLPMVTNPEELRSARMILEQAHQQLEAAGLAHRWPVPLGIMAEVPAVALCMKQFNGLSDFVSIGSNDLTQYTLASDRSNALLQTLGNAAHPAVLELCRKMVQDSHAPVSICGEAAGDPQIAPLLVDCGIRRLSMAPLRLSNVYKRVSGT